MFADFSTSGFSADFANADQKEGNIVFLHLLGELTFGL